MTKQKSKLFVKDFYAPKWACKKKILRNAFAVHGKLGDEKRSASWFKKKERKISPSAHRSIKEDFAQHSSPVKKKTMANHM